MDEHVCPKCGAHVVMNVHLHRGHAYYYACCSNKDCNAIIYYSYVKTRRKNKERFHMLDKNDMCFWGTGGPFNGRVAIKYFLTDEDAIKLWELYMNAPDDRECGGKIIKECDYSCV